MLNLRAGDMIETDQWDCTKLEIVSCVGVEGYLILDITPNQPKVRWHMERYIKCCTSLPYSSTIIRAEDTTTEIVSDKVKAKNSKRGNAYEKILAL